MPCLFESSVIIITSHLHFPIFPFSFCAWISSTTEFVVLSFLLRALSAFGGAASETAAMSIVMEEFPDRIAMASVCLFIVFRM